LVKGVFQKSCLDNIDTGGLDTSTSKAIELLYKLHNPDDSLVLIGNKDVEELAMNLAAAVTTNLKSHNESIILALDNLVKFYADNS
jgi:aryl-alcohol dehydrogenase-like predicted oxidoreductase